MPTVVASQLQPLKTEDRHWSSKMIGTVCCWHAHMCTHDRCSQDHCFLLQGTSLNYRLSSLGQWAYVGIKKRFFRLEMGTDGNWFLYPENKSLQQMWVTVVHLSCPRGSWMEFLEVREAQEQPAACRRDLQEIPTAQTGQLRTKIQPETGKGYPDTVRPPWSQPWEQRMPIFYKCRIEQRVFFISLQVQRSSEDATNPIILKEHEGFYAGNSLSIDHHFHQQLFIPSSHQ